jgi:hypothetical protein
LLRRIVAAGYGHTESTIHLATGLYGRKPPVLWKNVSATALKTLDDPGRRTLEGIDIGHTDMEGHAVCVYMLDLSVRAACDVVSETLNNLPWPGIDRYCQLGL